MSCGFGAFILLFLIIKDQANVAYDLPENYLEIEISTLESEIEAAKNHLQLVSQSNASTSTNIFNLERQLADSQNKFRSSKNSLSRNQLDPNAIEALRKKVESMKSERARLARDHDTKPSDVRTFTGDGDREYLTGMQLGGQRILILVDHSASMLDKSIVNILRRRNMNDLQKRKSKKWQQAIATVDWITARFPEKSSYQIYGFSEISAPVLPNTEKKWLKVANIKQLEMAFDNMRKIVPSGGSSLENAFLAVASFNPPPDNIYLITDGLPTLGSSKPTSTVVSGKQRLKLFESAVESLPSGIPVNTILLPMEGDPLAPWAFWGIAAVTKGSFLSPASDWP